MRDESNDFTHGKDVQVYVGDCVEALRTMPDASVQMCVTSPPYWGLRDYGEEGQLGLEKTPEKYVMNLVKVFREVRRVLRDDGTLWLNLGDSYAGSGKGRNADGSSASKPGSKQATNKGTTEGNLFKFTTEHKPKDLVGIPWMVAFALRSDGWWLRQDIIWSKPSCMPESVQDRCTKSHEYLFLLTKRKSYYYDAEAIKEPSLHTGKIVNPNGNLSGKYSDDGTPKKGFETHVTGMREVSRTRNKRSVWRVAIKPFSDAHFAVYPPELIEPCILAGTSERGCCEKCGGPWERVMEKAGTVNQKWGKQSKVDESRGDHADGSSIRTGDVNVYKMIGWQPTCTHDAPIVPCAVLDPFAGSGTTAGVAVKHGRKAILCELNPEYGALIPKRIEQISGHSATQKTLMDW